jgi:hypothetical protein
MSTETTGGGITDWQKQFLARFVGRGWLFARRSNAAEQAAVDAGLRAGLLRRDGGEVLFTDLGRQELGLK